MTEHDGGRARMVGINHAALEVGDLAAAIDLYGALFAFDIRGRTDSMAFLDMGDQFLALAASDEAGGTDGHRHLGVVVDDAGRVEQRLADLEDRGLERLDSSGIDVLDPWGNRLQIVEYGEIQFTKADHVLNGMGLSGLEKTDAAIAELAEKGMAPASSSDR